MPTKGEWKALSAAVNSALTTDYQDSGVSGLVLTDKTDSSKVLFLPCNSLCFNGVALADDNWGYFWLNTLYTSGYNQGLYAGFSNNNMYAGSSYIRCAGTSVRGVVG